MSVMSMEDSTLFSFDGRHCAEFGVAFVPEGYPFIPAQSIPGMRIAGRHGTLRWPGRTFEARELRGRLCLLESMGGAEPIAAQEMMHRASQIAAWLCGRDGRGRLILDAMPERYYVAEVRAQAALEDGEWASGSAGITFLCQPYARSVQPREQRGQAQAQTALTLRLDVDGNAQTALEFDVEGEESMDALEIEANGTRVAFEGLGMAAGERLEAAYTEDDILTLRVVGADGQARSAMTCRTMDSDDDVTLAPGSNEVTLRADAACGVCLRARGRWL